MMSQRLCNFECSHGTRLDITRYLAYAIYSGRIKGEQEPGLRSQTKVRIFNSNWCHPRIVTGELIGNIGSILTTIARMIRFDK